MSVDPKIVEKVKSDHPGVEVHELGSKSVAALFKSPNDATWGAFQDAREKVGTRAFKQLCRDCLLYPADAEFCGLLDRKPALANLIGKQLMDLAGMDEEVVVKKV